MFKKQRHSFSLIVLLSSMLALAACDSSTSEPAVDSKIGAAKIIEYTNKVLKFADKYRDGLESTYIKTEEAKAAKENPRRVLWPRINQLKMVAFSDYQFDQLLDTPRALGKEQQFFKDRLTRVKKELADLKDKADKLQSYLEAEDYKDDNFAGFDTQVSALQNQLTDAGEKLTPLFDKIEEVASQAEATNLEGHPLKAHFLSAKKMTTYAEKIVVALQTLEVDGDITTIETNYDLLMAELERAKQLDKEVLQEQGRLDSFERFLSNSIEEKFAPEARKFIRDFKAKNASFKRNYPNRANTLFNKYDVIVTGYNNFAT